MAYCIEFDVRVPRYLPDVSFQSKEVLNRLFTHSRDVLNVNTLADTDVPPEARLVSKQTKLPHIIPVDGFLSVSRIVADLIEAREPGVHQLMPVRVVPKTPRTLFYLDGTVIQDPFYLVNIRTKVDALCVERSVVETWPSGMTSLPWNGKAVLKKSVIAGLSLWMGRSQLFGSTFLSDEFASVLPNKGRALALTYCEEV